jgi:hypothetical protein
MSEIMGFVALVVSIVTVTMLKACREEINQNKDRLDGLTREIRRLQASSGRQVEETPSQPLEGVPEEVVFTSSAVQEPGQEVSVPPTMVVPTHPALQEVPADSVPPATETLQAIAKPEMPEAGPRLEAVRHQPKSPFDGFDRERWANLEIKLGKQWMT